MTDKTDPKTGTKFFTGAGIEIRVFNPQKPGDNPFGTCAGEAQLHIDGEWDNRDNWSIAQMRAAADTFTRAADHAQKLKEDR